MSFLNGLRSTCGPRVLRPVLDRSLMPRLFLSPDSETRGLRMKLSRAASLHRDEQISQNGCGRGILTLAGSTRTASATTDTRTASALMPHMVSSAGSPLSQSTSMTARCSRRCWIQRTAITSCGLILAIKEPGLRIFSIWLGLKAEFMRKGHAAIR
jgi:hypothetical protein